MADAICTGVALLLLYWTCLWLRICVHRNRLDRRRTYDPTISGVWVRPHDRYQNLSH